MNRRMFLQASAAAAGGLLVSVYLDPPALGQEGRLPPPKIYPPDAFVHIRPDGRTVITVNRVELGQGVHTALSMILADEMDADWSRVTAELAPAADVYRDPVFGLQMTGGSLAIANSFQQYREVGARTRAVLIATAADRWRISPGQCRAENSVVYGPGNQSASYGELADDAARMPVPETVTLKDPTQFRLIGKPVRRLDSRAKCDGSQKFGLDLDLAGMKTALLARPPIFGGRVRSVDDKEARRISGVREVFEIPLVKGSAVAVVADRFWAAKQARDILKIDWDVSGLERADSVQLVKTYEELAQTAGTVAANRGDIQELDRIDLRNRIVAEYEFPYLAHAPIEPSNTTIRFDGDRAEAWFASMLPTQQQAAIAEVLGLKPPQVTVHVEFAGGGFGRHTPPDCHVQREAAAIAKRIPGTPVKLVWTREDDIRGGYYRPVYVHRVEVGIGSDGMPIAWRQVVVGQSIAAGTSFEAILIKDGVDSLMVEGTVDSPYQIPNYHVSAHRTTVNVPIASWRSVGYTHNAFVRETIIDELAARARVDPIAYRLKLLTPEDRKFRRPLTLLQEKIRGWRDNLPQGHSVGIACNEYHGTGVACAVEVSIQDKRPKIHRATVAVDCGLAVNPLSVEAQCQGGIGFGLTQLMPKGAITLKDGGIQQRNFDGFTPPYIGDVPQAIDVHMVPSAEHPTAGGECPVPVISPAVVNALYRLTGKRYRALPLVTL